MTRPAAANRRAPLSPPPTTPRPARQALAANARAGQRTAGDRTPGACRRGVTGPAPQWVRSPRRVQLLAAAAARCAILGGTGRPAPAAPTDSGPGHHDAATQNWPAAVAAGRDARQDAARPCRRPWPPPGTPAVCRGLPMPAGRGATDTRGRRGAHCQSRPTTNVAGRRGGSRPSTAASRGWCARPTDNGRTAACEAGAWDGSCSWWARQADTAPRQRYARVAKERWMSAQSDFLTGDWC